MPVTWTEPSAVDETSAVTSTQTASPGDAFNLGTTQVVYTFSDASGNVAICSFTITLTGNISQYVMLLLQISILSY